MFLESGKIGLRPLERDDLEQAQLWRNDPVVRESFREYRPLSMVDQERWFDSLKNSIMFVIINKGSGEFIGVCGLCYIDQHNRSAEVSWYIGNTKFADKGLDKEIIKLLLCYGFDELGLHRIFAECYDLAEDRLYRLQEVGLDCEGTLRDVVYRKGRFWDSHVLSILEDKWRLQVGR